MKRILTRDLLKMYGNEPIGGGSFETFNSIWHKRKGERYFERLIRLMLLELHQEMRQ